MLLAIDVGNSDTKLGVFGGPGQAELQQTWRIQTALRRTADEFGVLFTSLFRLAGLDTSAIDAVAISSVVPQTDAALAEACVAYFRSEPAFFAAATQTLIEVTTERPKELGADLLAGAIAAKAAYGTPLVVVGFGTATTFGAVSREGEYRRGSASRSTRWSSVRRNCLRSRSKRPTARSGVTRFRPCKRASCSVSSVKPKHWSRACATRSGRMRAWSRPAAWPPWSRGKPPRSMPSSRTWS